MGVDAGLVGRTYDAGGVFEVGRERIREFADAIGDPNQAYRDPAAARALGHPDVVVPPTFPMILVFRGMERLLADPELGLALSRLLHGDQRFVHTRPVVVGDRLTCTFTVGDVKQAAGMDVIGTRSEVVDAVGDLVTTAYTTLYHRPAEG